jgi:long-chain acyl-CoA synthetase
MTPAHLLRAAAARTPGADALFCGERAITFAALDDSSDRLARWLLDEGLRPGDRVAVQWPNAIEAVQVLFAAFKAGLIAVPMNLRLKPAETAWVLEHAGASLCFAAPPLADAARQSGVRTLSELPVLPARAALPEIGVQAPALLMYTSGSTGRPKGAVLTQQNVIATADICRCSFEAGTRGAPARGLMMTPLMHSSGLYVLLAGLHAGEPTVLLPAFDAGAALDAIQRFRCTITLALPVMMQFLAEEQGRQPRDVSSMTVMYAGGDSVPVALQERVRQVMGAAVVEGLAQTETGPSLVNPIDACRPGSLGLPHGTVTLSIVGPTGEPVSDGEPGELLVHSPAMCAGYWRDPAATASALRDGWFHTGDLVSRDAEGYWWFRGRLKEIIVRGGSNISPQEVEEALYTHPDVLEAGVIGSPHEVWGEVVVAVVAVREGAAADAGVLREHARRTLADYKVPDTIHFLPVLPKGPTGKVHRRALKELFAAPRA